MNHQPVLKRDHDPVDLQNQRVALVPMPGWEEPPKTDGDAEDRRISIAAAFRLALAVPFVLAALYFLILAKPRYESVSTFVVRTPSGSTVSQLANLVQGSGIVSSSDDAYIVHEFIASRDAMNGLLSSYSLMKAFENYGWDPFWKVPGFFRRPLDEELFKHYLKFVTLRFDKTTGISTLRVQAFTPEDAKRLNEGLLDLAEQLLNKLNERALKDAIATARSQVEETRARAFEAQQKVTDFRNREAVIDPTLLSTALLETVGRLSVELALTNAQIQELTKASPDNPQIGTLRRRVEVLQNQIVAERARLAGRDTSLAPKIAEYERLSLDREFSERAFASAMSTLEVASVDAQRQRTFLERVSTPNLSDYADYPYAMAWLLLILAASVAVYFAVRAIWGDLLSHADN